MARTRLSCLSLRSPSVLLGLAPKPRCEGSPSREIPRAREVNWIAARSGGSSAGPSRACSSATGSGGSRPTNSWRSSAPRPSPSRLSHADPASTSLSCAAWPPTPAFATQSTTGHGSRSSAIPSARPSTRPFAGGATAMPAPCVPSPTACSRSPAPCYEPRPDTGLHARRRKMRPDLLSKPEPTGRSTSACALRPEVAARSSGSWLPPC